MKRKTPWFENDAFWAAFRPSMFGEERWQMAAKDAEPLARLLHLEPGASVLDLCCGPGRFSLELARRGYRVTGVDRTRSYLAEARRVARREKLEVEFVQADMRRFTRPRAFDAVINIFSSFGYFRRESDDLRVCRNVHRSLQPGGRFLIETIGKEGLARRYQCRDWQEVGGELVLHEVVPVDGWSALEQRRVLVRKGRTYEFRLWMRLYSAAELRGLLEQAGFRSVRTYGAYDGSPYDSDARRLVVVGRK